jgi:aminopeptidase N
MTTPVSPLWRTFLGWQARWLAPSSGEASGIPLGMPKPPAEFIELVLGNIAHESESTTIEQRLDNCRLVARNYVSPARRSAVLEDVATRVWELARAPRSAGSDAQFQLVKAFAALASTSEHADNLRSLDRVTVTLDGLTIDTDLSWELLSGLALCGASGLSDIDAGTRGGQHVQWSASGC